MAGMQEYGALIKSAREQQGMTIEQVATELGRPGPFAWRLEQGKNANPPDPETMRGIWRVLGVSLRTQLETLGYLDPEDQELGVAYVIREDDPRKEVIGLLEGLSATRIAPIEELISLFLLHSTNGRNAIGSDERHDKPHSA